MRQALELALEALEGFIPYLPLKDEAQCNRYDKAITAIKEALAQPEQWGASAVTHPEYVAEQKRKTEELRSMLTQPEQEPVAYLSNKRQRLNIELKPQTFVEIPTVTDWEMPLYMKPPQRKPLTRERLVAMAEAQCGLERTFEDWVELFAREIEAAHGIKE